MLSVVIPTSTANGCLVPTLAMLVPAAMSGVVREVIIADAGRPTRRSRSPTSPAAMWCVFRTRWRQRLREAAATARAPWLMFLRPGTVLDTTWLDETMNFIEETERGDAADRRRCSARRCRDGPPIRC